MTQSSDKKNVFCTNAQKKLLREFYLGQRTARHFAAYRFVQRLQMAGLIEDDGLDYPWGAGFNHKQTYRTPKWVIVQAARIATCAVLIPEAERIIDLDPTTPKPLSRYSLFKELGIPRSGATYKKIAPDLTINMSLDLLDAAERGLFNLTGLHPWFPTEKFDRAILQRPHPYPPIAFDPYLDDEWYDRFGEDFEELDGSLEPIPWNRRWSNQLLVPTRSKSLPNKSPISDKKPIASNKKSSSNTKPPINNESTMPDKKHEDKKQEILDLF